MSVETSQPKHKKKKDKKKKRSKILKDCQITTNYVTYNSNTRKRKNRIQKIVEATITENFPKINVRHQTKDPGSSKNSKQNAYQKSVPWHNI
jgi:hypothetical protein